MHRFNKRYSDLIYHLLNNNRWCNIAELSNKIAGSKSTIWRDLEFLESIFPKGWCLERHETLGVRLIRPENGTLESLLGEIKEKNSYLHTLKLILFNDGVDISQIIQEVHISRSTAYRHLEKLQEVVCEAGVSLSTSPYKVIGEEKKIRNFIMHYLDFMSFESLNMKETFDATRFQKELLQLFSKYSLSYRTGALRRLTLILSIANHRVSMGYNISFPTSLLTAHQGSKYFELARELEKYMTKCHSRENQLNEILFFSIHIMSEERPLNRLQELNYIKKRMKNNEARPLVHFLNDISDYIGIDLSQDEIFLFHLYQTIKRITVETEFETETIRTSMLQFLPYFETSPLFQVLNDLAIKSFSSMPLNFTKMDVLEMFTLIQAAILRKWEQHSIEVVLVSRNYYEKDFIKEVLKYHFGNKVSIYTVDPSEMDVIFRYEDIDLIISTDSVHASNTLKIHIPIAKISSFPTSLELMDIKHFIEHQFYSNLGMSKEMLYPFNSKECPC